MREDKHTVLSKPKAGAGDALHTLAKAGISMFPYGGAAAQLFSAVVSPPLNKRKDEWVESIATALKALEEKVEGFEMKYLSQKEAFITTFMYATQTAIHTHRKEKLGALRNAVLNSALPNAPDDDIQAMFLNFIDALTPWHLRLLKFFNNPKEWKWASSTDPVWTWNTMQNPLGYAHVPMGSLSGIIEHTFPELRYRKDFYSQICKDLSSRGLIGDVSLGTGTSFEGMFDAHITSFGKQFLDFITSPIEEESK